MKKQMHGDYCDNVIPVQCLGPADRRAASFCHYFELLSLRAETPKIVQTFGPSKNRSVPSTVDGNSMNCREFRGIPIPGNFYGVNHENSFGINQNVEK